MPGIGPGYGATIERVMRFAIDTGGTFTDLVVEDDEHKTRLYKTPTVTSDRVQGVVDSLKLAADDFGLTLSDLLGRGELLIHGTTTATNAIVTGATAKTAFLTTAGHPDILLLREGGRMGLPMFDYSVAYPKPYVPRALTFEVSERIGAGGEVVRPLDEVALLETLVELRGLDVEAVGVCLLWSIVNNEHERRVGELLHATLPGVPVTLSHELNPAIREYRRASSTCIDASLKPLMGRYLNELESRLRALGYESRLLVATSQGAVRDAQELAYQPIHTVKSGPAMAPVAGKYYARTDAGAETAIVTDAGGTTYDVSLIRDGRIPETRETWLGRPFLGHMTGFASIDVRSVGAGGGSIASVDDAGLLTVGPNSAGSEPGPACYGLGGLLPTLTDACLVLGILDPEHFLGGRMKLLANAARQAVDQCIGRPMDLDTYAAAAAIVDVATETMARAIEDVTVNQGIDPATAVLVGGGGAAGFNAVAIARRIGCPTVLVPSVGATLSAGGALLSDLGAEFGELFVTTRRAFDAAGVDAVLERLRIACEDFAGRVGMPVATTTVEFFVEARYAHQVWEIKVPLRVGTFTSAQEVEQLWSDFHALHHDIFAIDDERADIELIIWRARVTCAISRRAGLSVVTEQTGPEPSATRAVYFSETGLAMCPVYLANTLSDDMLLAGPAIVESPFTTIVIDSKSTVRLSSSGGLLIDVEPQVNDG